MDGVFCFTDVMFMALCASDSVNCIGGGDCCVCRWVVDEFSVSEILFVFECCG